jgi:hypothetical protein
MSHKRGKPLEGESRKLTRAERHVAGLGAGFWIRTEGAQISFFRKTPQRVNRFAKTSHANAAFHLEKFWNNGGVQ